LQSLTDLTILDLTNTKTKDINPLLKSLPNLIDSPCRSGSCWGDSK
jgi:hypothetical protein